MPLPIYLAMTAAELRNHSVLPDHVAWMACHFSPYGTGLSNCPATLPPGSMLILNDRTPVYGHDPQRIAEQMCELAAQLGCSRVLLDLQRPNEPATAAIAKAVSSVLPCPVAVSAWYAGELTCPVLLPPVALLKTPQEHLLPWKDREIWLELARDTACYTITEAGCRRETAVASGEFPHTDPALCCRYRIAEEENAVRFHITQDQGLLLEQLTKMDNVTCLVGLYQELG